MKKLLIIMFLFAFIGMAKAQTATINLGSNTSAVYNVSKTLTDNVVQYFVWNAPKEVPISLDYSAILTKVSGTHTDVTVVLYGKCFAGDAWVQIASISSGEISSTYKVTISSSATLQYRYFKTEYTGAGTATTTITDQELKIWLR